MVRPIIFDKTLSYLKDAEGYEGDAGFDLRSAEFVIIPNTKHHVFDVGIGFDIPDGVHGRVTGRSSFNIKGVICAEGIVDCGYKGSVRVTLHNFSGDDLIVHIDEKIAQIVFIPFVTPPVTRKGKRNVAGFGSTGRF